MWHLKKIITIYILKSIWQLNYLKINKMNLKICFKTKYFKETNGSEKLWKFLFCLSIAISFYCKHTLLNLKRSIDFTISLILTKYTKNLSLIIYLLSVLFKFTEITLRLQRQITLVFLQTKQLNSFVIYLSC